jgi:hypothetical protein
MQLSLFNPPDNLGDNEWTPDDWQTPTSVASSMAALLTDQDKSILEPCAGVGQIASQLPNHAIANELNPGRYRQGCDRVPHLTWSNLDFLTEVTGRYDVIITNPPFSLCCEFIQHGLRLLNRSNPNARLLFLLPLDWNCPQGRAAQWVAMDAHIHHEYRIKGRVAYLDAQGVAQSRRQCSDAVFDIRPGKLGAAVTYL